MLKREGVIAVAMTPQTKTILNQKAYDYGLEASDIQRAIVNYAVDDHHRNGFPRIPMNYLFGKKSEHVNFRVDITVKNSIENICKSTIKPSSYINIYAQLVLELDISEIVKFLPTDVQLPLYYEKGAVSRN